jgi:hypothetical protein
MGVAEPIFDYSFQNPTTGGAHSGWRFKADRFGPQQPYQPGDTIIAFVVARTDAYGPGGPDIRVEGITTDGSDWSQDVDYQFDDDGLGFGDPHSAGFYSVAVFRKIWTTDDPVDYQVDFTGVTIPSPDFEEAQFLMYCAHAGGTSPTFSPNDGSAHTDAFAGAPFERNFGDGESSWGYTAENPLTNGFGTWGYHPGSWWGYYEFEGVNIYLWTDFGLWRFGFNVFGDPDQFFFHPAENVDNDLGGGGTTTPTIGRLPFESFTLAMCDVLLADVIRISGNARRFRHIEVS